MFISRYYTLCLDTVQYPAFRTDQHCTVHSDLFAGRRQAKSVEKDTTRSTPGDLAYEVLS